MEYLLTVSGRYAKPSEVRKIKGKFYHYEDLVKLDGVYYRKDTGKVVYDLDAQKWVKNTPSNVRYLLYFIDNVPVFGISQIPRSMTAGDYFVHNELNAYILGFKYSSEYNGFSIQKKDRRKFPNKQGLPYSLELTGKHKHIPLAKQTNIFSSKVRQCFDDFFSKFSLGYELETDSGYLTDLEISEIGAVMLRDGSIPNVEFASLPIKSSTDFSRIKNLFSGNYFSISPDCSLHIHVGGVPKENERYIVSLYYLCFRIQSELHSCVPSFRKSEKTIAKHNKDYGKFLKSFGMEYEKVVDPLKYYKLLISFMSQGKTNQLGRHPLEGRQKWDYQMRYYYLNILNFFFKESGTVEFRLFPATTYYSVFMCWMLLTMCIVHFAFYFPEIVLSNKEKINLQTIVENSFLTSELKYVLLRFIRETSYISYEETILDVQHFDNYIHKYSNLNERISNQLEEALCQETGELVTTGNELVF